MNRRETDLMNGKKVRKALAFHIPVVLLSIVMIYPLAWMIASSLKEKDRKSVV